MKSVLLSTTILLTIVLPASSIIAQRQDDSSRDTIAHVGSTAITSRDLQLRVELMPFPGAERNTDSLKAKALYAMIAEKLLAYEAKQTGLPQSKRTKLLVRELENVFIRDAMYRREIAAKVEPSEKQITEGMKRLPTVLAALSFLVQTPAEGAALAKKLRTAKPESVLSGLPPSLYTQVDTIPIRFGGPDEAYEDAAFGAGKARASTPFYSRDFGWAVVYVLEKRPNTDVAEMNDNEQRHRVEQIIRRRLESAKADKYYFQLLQTKQARADERMFHLLADSLSALLTEDSAYARKSGYQLTSELVEILIDRLESYLDSALVLIDGGDVTLGEIVEMLRYEDFLFRYSSGNKFKLELNEEVKNLVGKELLARQGRSENIQFSEAVQNDLLLWTDYISAGGMYYRVRDSVTVTDEEVIQHLIRNKEVFGRHYEVNVREVLCDSMQTVQKVLDGLQQGKALADLAKQYSMRTEWANKRGESGYFQVVHHPELGFRALWAETGKLVGPVKLPEGYSLFTVLGKRRTKDALVSFDTLQQNIRSRLLNEQRKQAVNRLIANLAREQRLSIDHEKLRKVKVSMIPMFTRRQIGFGGKMSAFPILLQQWDWIDEYREPALP